MPGSLDSFVESLEKLIAKFEADKAHYLSKEYLEAQAKTDIIIARQLNDVVERLLHRIVCVLELCYGG